MNNDVNLVAPLAALKAPTLGTTALGTRDSIIFLHRCFDNFNGFLKRKTPECIFAL